MKEIRLVLGILVWVAETLWLGLQAGVRALRLAIRLPGALRRDVRCPRGHRVAAYGTYVCGQCGGQFEGAAFGSCPACGALTRYLPCPKCGLAIRDPLR